MHRIRFAMAPVNKSDGGKLKGTVEVDETYIGGKPRHRQTWKPKFFRTEKMRVGHVGKMAVFGAVERKGRVRARVVPNVTAKTLSAAITEHVDKASKLMSDENTSYKAIGKEFPSHQTVAHCRREYVRGDVTTNTIESFWAILKRGIYGVYHNVSSTHLQRYLDEFEFRYNTRKLDDGERTLAAIQGAVGKRLAYSEQVV